MSVLPGKALHEAIRQWTSALDACDLPKSLIREIFMVFLLLRWVDHAEAEQEAMAIFEDRPYLPLLPTALQWRHWAQLEHPDEMAERLRELAPRLEAVRKDASHPVCAWLHTLAAPLRRLIDINFAYLHNLVRWVDALPFETPAERRALLEVFDQVVAETGDPHDGQYATPANIAHLVAALANPQPGERVYDPCFGSGNFLVAAWQHAERSRNDSRSQGALLDIAGIEINASAFLVGLTRMLLAGIDTPHLELGDSLERDAPSSPSREGFDVVLANPPIGVKTSRDPRRYQHFAIPTNDSVGLFIQHALSQLKPRGRAVIAVPEGFLFRGGAERELRRYLVERGQIEAVIGLPAGAFAPYTNLKGSLLLLNQRGGVSRVRMVDAATQFELRSGRKAPVIRHAIAQQLATEVRRPELRKPRELPPGIPEGTPGSGVLSRSMWEVNIEALAAVDWDLTPRRGYGAGGLAELLVTLKEVSGNTGTVSPLFGVAEVMAGRKIRSADLLDEPPNGQAVGYVRIKDLAQGKVGRPSGWLRPEIASTEKRWALLPGDVLVSRSGTIGKAALVRNGAVGAVAANGLYVLRVEKDRLDASFLLAYLASPACQNWLAAQSRGAVVQHLNRTALDGLMVPLPPLPLQARAAAQFREFGTDVLTFLAQARGGNEADLTTWLAELTSQTPSFVAGIDDTPALSLVEPLVAMASTARRWLEQDRVSSQAARWLLPLTDTLLPLAGVAQIPPGPGLLGVLQNAERGALAVLEHGTGHLPTEAQARAIAERLREWLRAAITDLVDAGGLLVRSAPASLVAGSFAEFSVELGNDGWLPLRSVRVETSPDWGIAEVPYLAEHGALAVNLRGDVPKQAGQLSLRLNWSARTLAGQAEIGGEVELAIRIAEPDVSAAAQSAELGGSPYVTGSPLMPQHGHDVFFGREDLIRQVSRQIATNGNVVLLEGNRRAGKTSVLNHLEGYTAIPGWLAVYCSLQGAEGAAHIVGVPTTEVFRAIARSVATALTKLGGEVPLPNGQVIRPGDARGVAHACREGIGRDSPFVDFRDYLELVLSALEPSGLGLVLMLDEFDKLQEGIDNGVTSPQVPENIRFLIQTYPRFSAILTGSRRLKRLREEYWSALYGLGTNIPVTALDMQSARSVVIQPVRGKLIFSNEAVERVIELTARQPYLMQCLCNLVFDYAVVTTSRSITLGVVNDAAQNLIRDTGHFADLWDYARLGPETGQQRRQLILLLCARSFKQGTHISFGTLHEHLAQAGVDVEDDALAADLDYLRELELVEFSGESGGGQYRLAIPLMADWIEQKQDTNVVSSRARSEAEEESA